MTKLRSDEQVVPGDGHAVLDEADTEITEYPRESSDHDLLAISAAVKLDQAVANLIVGAIPPLSVMRSDEPWAAKTGLLVSMLGEEAISTELGAHTMRERLTQVLFINCSARLSNGPMSHRGGSPER